MKHLPNITVTVFLILSSFPVSPRCYGQQSIYGELLGNSIAVSLNYDHIAASGFGGRVGVGLSTFDRETGISIPFELHYVVGVTHRAEFGMGIAYSSMEAGVYPLSTVAYRYQPDGHGILFRVALNLFQLLDSYPILGSGNSRRSSGLPVCVSIGYTF